MLIYSLIHFIGFLYMGMISCDEIPVSLLSIEPTPINDVAQVDLSINDDPFPSSTDANNFGENMDNTVVTSSQTPEVFSCYQCTNCTSKSNFLIQTCGSDITMCFTLQKRLDNTTHLTHRGCSASKLQCSVPNDDQQNPFMTITCCTTPKCNQANQSQPVFFLSCLSLLMKIFSSY